MLAFLFERIVIGHRRAALDRACRLDRAAGMQQGFEQSCFAGARLSCEGDVADVVGGIGHGSGPPEARERTMRPAGRHEPHRAHRLDPSPEQGSRRNARKRRPAGDGRRGPRRRRRRLGMGHLGPRAGLRGFAVIAPDLMPGPAGIEKTSFHGLPRSQVMDWCRGAARRVVLAARALAVCSRSSAAQRVKPLALVLINPLPPAGVLARPLYEPTSADRAVGARALARLDATRDARCRRRGAPLRAASLARRIGRGAQRSARGHRRRNAALPEPAALPASSMPTCPTAAARALAVRLVGGFPHDSGREPCRPAARPQRRGYRRAGRGLACRARPARWRLTAL